MLHATAVQGHLANISLNTKNRFSTDHWPYVLPADVVVIPLKTLWTHCTLGKTGTIHKEKTLAKG